MGTLIDLDIERRARAAERDLEALLARLEQPAPSPETWGWTVLERDASGRPSRWYHVRYRATIGGVPTEPGRVFLDYQNVIRAWDGLSVEDLAVALEAGTLPEPDVELDWRGER